MKGSGIIVSQLNKFVNASYDPNPPQTIDDYQLDQQLTNNKVKVYYNGTKIVVVNRGTAGTVSDWANNARYAMGSYDETDRLAQAVATQKEVIEKYGRLPDVNIGHSQGGIITRKLNAMGLCKQVINVNPAITTEIQKKNEYNVRSSSDMVSALSVMNPFMRSKKNTTIKSESWNPLNEHSANILERLDPNLMIGKGLMKTNELSNVDIDELVAYHGIKNFHGSFIDHLLPKKLYDGYYMINLNGESHWTALLKNGRNYYYFDSYGFVASQEVEDKIKSYVYSDVDLQSMSSTSCGFYSLAWMMYLQKYNDKKLAYAKFLKCFSKDTRKNERILHQMLK
jgi:hypothetical protein